VRATAGTLAVLLLAAGCGRTLEDGTYRFDTTAIRQDSCSAEPQDDLALPDGRVTSAGETVRIAFAAEGPLVPGLTGASGDKALIGRYLPDKEEERFIADASFDVVREVAGLSCFVFAHAAVRARVEDETSFSGTLRIDYRRRAEAQAACLPSCVVEVEFAAARIGE